MKDSLPERLNEETKLFFGCSYTELLMVSWVSFLLSVLSIPLIIFVMNWMGLYRYGWSLLSLVVFLPAYFLVISRALGRLTDGKHKGYLLELVSKKLPINRSCYFDLDGKLSNKRFIR